MIVIEFERQIGFINVRHLIIYPGTEDITVGMFVTVIQASCQATISLLIVDGLFDLC